jgi:hypothetical protein
LQSRVTAGVFGLYARSVSAPEPADYELEVTRLREAVEQAHQMIADLDREAEYERARTDHLEEQVELFGAALARVAERDESSLAAELRTIGLRLRDAD